MSVFFAILLECCLVLGQESVTQLELVLLRSGRLERVPLDCLEGLRTVEAWLKVHPVFGGVLESFLLVALLVADGF